MKKLLFVALFFAGLYSCKKDRGFDGNCTGSCFTFEGRILEKQTGSVLENAGIKFYYKKPPTLSGGTGRDYLGVATSGSDGSYYFSFPKSSTYYTGGNFIVETSKEGYIAGISEVDISYGADSVFSNDRSLWKAAPLTIRVRTVNNTNFDRFYFNQFYGDVSLFNFDPIDKNRQPFDVTYNLQTAADIPTRINWRTTNLNPNTGSTILQGSDTIIVAAGTSGNLLIGL
ncbi:MAG: hypothetical protein H7Y86_07080 [Rhizobacter sp.]|nr:hypothetical protein [Ferruginibacter sp.]